MRASAQRMRNLPPAATSLTFLAMLYASLWVGGGVYRLAADDMVGISFDGRFGPRFLALGT
jgi:hypothetical protein